MLINVVPQCESLLYSIVKNKTHRKSFVGLEPTTYCLTDNHSTK